MTTSSLSLRESGRRRWFKPISSALLDDLMSCSNCKSPTGDNTDHDSGTSEETPSKSKPSPLMFTPSQLHNVKRKLTDTDNDEGQKTSKTQRPRITISFSAESTNSPYRNRTNSSSDSSVYLTPDSTPRTHRVYTSTPDVAVRSCLTAKRSLDTFYLRTDQSPFKTGLNSSEYLSPNQSLSPSYTDTPVKRLKTRWSNGCESPWTDTSICLDVSNSSGSGGGDVAGPVEPELIGYQLVGDSQFCRFGQQLLGLQRVPMANSSGRIGICVSGQTITDLHRRVKEKFYPLSDKIILMIGTNDFLRNVDVGRMCDELRSLIRSLQKSVANIVVLTLPPIPKIANRQHSYHFRALDKYNSFIRSLDNGDSLRIADVSPIYMSAPPYQQCRMDLFEMYFFGNKRHDLIHLNRQGLEVIRSYILEHFMDT